MNRNASVNNYVLVTGASLRDALIAITQNRHRATVVVDNKNYYLGYLSDGDIRRALLRGAILETPVESIMNLNAKILTPKEKSQANTLFKKFPAMSLIPVVDDQNKLVDIITND